MPYRDDEQALQAKKEQLEQDRARIEEHKRTLAHLADDETRVNRELVDIERRLAKRKKNLPLLGDVRVASPCPADWNAMQGDDQSRFCDKCAKNVYNLSALTKDQAEALIREKEGNLCVRYYERADGTVLTADCLVGVRRKRVKAAAFVAAVGAVAGMGIQAFAHSFVQGEMQMREVRGSIDAFDQDDVAEQIEMKTTVMGGAMFPGNEAQHDEVAQKVEQAHSKAKPIQNKVAPKKPIEQKKATIR